MGGKPPRYTNILGEKIDMDTPRGAIPWRDDTCATFKSDAPWGIFGPRGLELDRVGAHLAGPEPVAQRQRVGLRVQAAEHERAVLVDDGRGQTRKRRRTTAEVREGSAGEDQHVPSVRYRQV